MKYEKMLYVIVESLVDECIFDITFVVRKKHQIPTKRTQSITEKRKTKYDFVEATAATHFIFQFQYHSSGRINDKHTLLYILLKKLFWECHNLVHRFSFRLHIS